jgi:hypothetical protein
MTRAISMAISTALAIGWIASIPTAALAQSPPPGGAPPARAGSSVGAVLSELERNIIDEYYRLKSRMTGVEPAPQPGAEPPRRAGSVTRGIQQDTETKAGAALPSGVRRDPLPADLRAKLPPSAPGTDRVLVGGDVALIDKTNNVVLDVMPSVAPRAP